jgi:hypothetical protein
VLFPLSTLCTHSAHTLHRVHLKPEIPVSRCEAELGRQSHPVRSDVRPCHAWPGPGIRVLLAPDSHAHTHALAHASQHVFSRSGGGFLSFPLTHYPAITQAPKCLLRRLGHDRPSPSQPSRIRALVTSSPPRHMPFLDVASCHATSSPAVQITGGAGLFIETEERPACDGKSFSLDNEN